MHTPVSFVRLQILAQARREAAGRSLRSPDRNWMHRGPDGAAVLESL
jgi:hypothetical protein